MAKLEYSEIREGKIIIHDDEPAVVVESHVARTQQRKPQNQVKLKSLITGKTISATFHVADMADEAEIEKREVMFLYRKGQEFWFCDPKNKGDRFKLDADIIDDNTKKFLKENEVATALVWDNDGEEQTIGLNLPIKMTFRVKEAPPAVRGDTSKGGNKYITLENGASITTPMFINEGDRVIINTETGEYVERA